MNRKNITIDDETLELLERLGNATGNTHSALIRKGIRLLDEEIKKMVKEFVDKG